MTAHPASALYTDGAQAQYQHARAEVLAKFEVSSRIEPLWRGLTKAMDALLSSAFVTHASSASAQPTLALVAVGGYGRGEMFPHSDVDVLVLRPDDSAHEEAEALVRQLFALHGGISHAARTVAESIAAAREEHSIAASMLDARLVAGDGALFAAFAAAFAQQVIGHDAQRFVMAKLDERDARHTKWGDSRFMLEPQVKEGKGSLRDLQTLHWLSRYCFGEDEAPQLLTAVEWKQYRAAYRFFATVRAQLHCLRGRADERLTFDVHTAIAARLRFRGRTPQQQAERMMRRYFHYARATGALTRIFCAGLDAQHLRPAPVTGGASMVLPEGLTLEEGRLTVQSAEAVVARPALAVELFAVASAHELAIHSQAYLALARALPSFARTLRRNTEANQLFLALLLQAKTPELYLRG